MLGGLGSFGHLGAAGVAGSSVAPPVSWDPTQLSGLVAYYNASSIIQAGGTVIQLPDLGPIGFPLSPTGTAPAWSATSFNGGAGITWNGDSAADDLLSDTAAAFPSLTDLSITILFSMDPATDGSTEWVRFLGIMADGDSNDYQTATSLGLGEYSSSGQGELLYDGYVNNDGWTIATTPTCWILNGTNGSAWDPYVNFVSTPTGAGDQAAAIGGANSIIGIGPAGVGGAGGTLTTGTLSVATAIITSNPLTSTDMSNLKTWMNTNWHTSF